MPHDAAPDDAPVVIVIGALAPYTHALYEPLAEVLDCPLHVIACSGREPSRHWDLPARHGYRFETMSGLRWHRSTISNLYVNPAIILRLRQLAPRAVILNDFSPTMLMAAQAARLLGIPYGIQTDGVPETDPGRSSALHRWMRRAIIGSAEFGIGAGTGSLSLLGRYGLDRKSGVIAPLFPAWTPQGRLPAAEARPYDLLFCGVLNEEVKGARFFTDVVLGCLALGRRLRVRVTGDGPLRAEMQARFAAAGVEARFDGFLQKADLAEAYGSARLFHFPSRGDVWGLVVNEALQCGTAVLASPHSGAAREMLDARGCGVVRPLETNAWIETTLVLLDDPAWRARLQEKAAATLAEMTPTAAAAAYVAALRTVERHRVSQRQPSGQSYDDCIIGGISTRDLAQPVHVGNRNVMWPPTWSEARRADWRAQHGLPGLEWQPVKDSLRRRIGQYGSTVPERLRRAMRIVGGVTGQAIGFTI